jgi:hypothetical protein
MDVKPSVVIVNVEPKLHGVLALLVIADTLESLLTLSLSRSYLQN